MREPDLTVKIYLVPYGYQVDFFDIDDRLRISTCRDFSSERPVKFWIDQMELYMAQAIEKLRRTEGKDDESHV